MRWRTMRSAVATALLTGLLTWRQTSHPHPSEADLDHLLDEFGRYARDYDVLGAASVSEATQIVERMAAGGQPVALLVVDSRLTGVGQIDGYRVMHTLRTLVPTMTPVTSRWENFLEDSKTLRPAVAKGKIDVVALTPQGPRDGEVPLGRHRPPQ